MFLLLTMTVKAAFSGTLSVCMLLLLLLLLLLSLLLELIIAAPISVACSSERLVLSSSCHRRRLDFEAYILQPTI